MDRLTISKVANIAEVGVETVRFYHRKGLIKQPSKPASGAFRVYPLETVQRIRFIRQAQELGFSLREVKDLIALRAIPSSDCSEVRNQAQIKLDEVNRKIGQLKRMRTALDQLIAACPGKGALQACSIMEAMMGTEIQTSTKKKGKKVNV